MSWVLSHTTAGLLEKRASRLVHRPETIGEWRRLKPPTRRLGRTCEYERVGGQTDLTVPEREESNQRDRNHFA